MLIIAFGVVAILALVAVVIHGVNIRYDDAGGIIERQNDQLLS